MSGGPIVRGRVRLYRYLPRGAQLAGWWHESQDIARGAARFLADAELVCVEIEASRARECARSAPSGERVYRLPPRLVLDGVTSVR
jgi:hypothetical protein